MERQAHIRPQREHARIPDRRRIRIEGALLPVILDHRLRVIDLSPTGAVNLLVDPQLGTGLGERAVDALVPAMHDDEAGAVAQEQPTQDAFGKLGAAPVPVAGDDDPHARILSGKWTSEQSLSGVIPSLARSSCAHRIHGIWPAAGTPG